MEELLSYALSGVNLIPTVFFVVIILYWLSVIIGVVDLDLFDFDIDIDIDTDLVENTDVFQSILAFLNLREIPLMVVLSVQAVVFWINAMFLCKVIANPGGFQNGLLLIPLFILCLMFTKVITTPLKGVFKKVNMETKSEDGITIGKTVILVSEVKDGRLGQGEIERDGASHRVNVKAQNEEESFEKNEKAMISKKDSNKNIYYIIKIEGCK